MSLGNKKGGHLGTGVLVGVPLAYLALFFYLPLGHLLWDSLGARTTVLMDTLRDPYYWRLLLFTAKQAAYSSLASVALGLPLGYLLANVRLPFPRLWRALTLVPFVLPTVVVALGFIVFFGHNGYLNQALGALLGVRIPILYSLTGIVLAHAFYNAPVVARTTAGAWERLDPALEQAARACGASPWRVWLTITLPLIGPAVLSGALLAFIFSFFSFPIVLALGGARYSTLEVEVYTQVRLLYDYATGASVALLQTIASLALTFVYLWAEARRAVRLVYGRMRAPRPLRGSAQLLIWLFLLLCGLLYLGPIGAMVWESLRVDGQLTGSAYAFIFQTQHEAQFGNSPLAAVANSLRFGLGTLVVAVTLGTCLSVGLAALRGWPARVLETLAMAPLAVSSIAFGFAMLRAHRTGVLASLKVSPELAIVVAHATLGLPFVLRVLRPHFRSFDVSLVLAARSLGASPGRAFRQIVLPLSLGPLLVAAAFAFCLSVAEMSATIMLSRPGLVTMPLGVYHLIAARRFEAASAMAVLLMGCVLVVFLGIEAGGRRLTQTRSGGREGRVVDL